MQLSDEEIEAYEKEIERLPLGELKRRLKELPDDPEDIRKELLEFQIEDVLKANKGKLIEHLEQKYKRSGHKLTTTLRGFALFLLVSGFFYYYVVGEPAELTTGIFTLCACWLFGLSAIIDRRFKFYMDLYHRDADPTLYGLNVGATFVLGVMAFAIGLMNHLKIC